jgi:hypothetical protein
MGRKTVSGGEAGAASLPARCHRRASRNAVVRARVLFDMAIAPLLKRPSISL